MTAKKPLLLFWFCDFCSWERESLWLCWTIFADVLYTSETTAKILYLKSSTCYPDHCQIIPSSFSSFYPVLHHFVNFCIIPLAVLYYSVQNAFISYSVIIISSSRELLHSGFSMSSSVCENLSPSIFTQILSCPFELYYVFFFKQELQRTS